MDGGEGNDYIQASVNSTVSGGAGDDTIRLTNKGATVNFSKGDGNDTILAHDDLTLTLGGYSKDDVVVTKEGDISVLSFKGADDTIRLDLANGATAHLVFEDGAILGVKGTDTKKAFDTITSNLDSDPQVARQHYVRSQWSSKNL